MAQENPRNPGWAGVDGGGWGSGGIFPRWNPGVGSEVLDPKVVDFLVSFLHFTEKIFGFSSNANGGSSFRDS